MVWLASCLGEVQRLSLLSLFAAALAIVAVYLVQYGLSVLRQGGGKPPASPPAEVLQGDEEDSLFAWLLSLPSWRSEWQKAWLAALNAEAKVREVRGRTGVGGADGQHSAPETGPRVARAGWLAASFSFSTDCRVAAQLFRHTRRSGMEHSNLKHLDLERKPTP